MIRTSLEHYQHEIGSFASIFDLNFDTYIHFTSPTWLTCLWGFVSEHNINLSHTSPTRPQHLRLHDKAIMDIFYTEYNLPTSTLQSINRVRCHLQLFSLADLATGDGTKIRNQYILGLKDNLGSNWEWQIEQPSHKDIIAWKSAMKSLINT